MKTKELRHSEGGFFKSFKPPHKAVTSTTIARWVVNVLKEVDQQFHQKPVTKV